MYAVIETGGKQYRVQQGDVILIEKLKAEAGAQIEFDKVLVLGEGDQISLGKPYLDSVVTGKVVENGKGEKVIVYKYKAKKDYRKKQGHRQPFTKVEIVSLGGKSSGKKAVAEKAVEKLAEDGPEANKSAPNFKGMKKAEIIEFAKKSNIEVDEKATIAVLIETITEAMK
jgi:large subunit ribosomal protein L21